jgi:hypothetical protein
VRRLLLVGDSRIPEFGFISPELVDDLASRDISALESLGFVGVLELGDSMWTGLSQFFGTSLLPIRLNTTRGRRLDRRRTRREAEHQRAYARSA